ncbi:MAG TPA: hypothetical protein VF612_02170 [Jatrophihabitans sp.]|uniref:hypothetical protein n=1 Tax=Jatrophihabitans sp. TaxID=1932789 RepID=UPI002EDF53E4
MLAEDGAESPETRAGTQSPAEHIHRLGQLIEQQAEELEAAEAGWRELAAMCDLAQWAAEGSGDGTVAVVRVDDLRRLLARRHGTRPVPDGSS